jgi:hypothetical protein
MMVIDMGVSDRIDLKINQSMTADLMEHVIEKGHAGAGLAGAAAIQIQAHLHIGFTGHSMDLS